MYFFDAIYYNYYIFYLAIYKERDPSFTAKLALSASESFLVIAIASMISGYFFCHKFGRVESVIIIAVILLINFVFVLSHKREKIILKRKPLFFKNGTVTAFIVCFFFIFTSSILFWLNDIVNWIIGNCR